MICISIGKIGMIDEVNQLKPSLVEVRYDLIRRSPEMVVGQLNDTILHVATCRPGIISDNERLDILRESIDLGAVYVDIELESDPDFLSKIIRYARKKSTHVIISYHNFDETPDTNVLRETLKQCYDLGGDVAKIACQVKILEDSARLLSLYAEKGRKVVLGMGNFGKITRIAATQLGAEFTFASLNVTDATAPGQLTYSEMKLIDKMLNN